ncbi:HlyD family efflux transporter periplasmic adaptor subunit [Faecalibacterium prausnitzii]|uniref:efflux RND transporter periplasmic adaptor subunit n=1 Tax=Faecalibacterium prausnitzii TaxID=853 RepID=UPI001C2783BD|nr:HlyD family efflux transporter periplasmic adaptor subunit [Faecalibacterium prausnitzii]MBU8988405.1 HlyD family efflux transporter periplasmic adaptor subunit [Faecalibacterium prausnitzii]MCQ5156598.1 HlyD family efflux transporter periplasmic adaptor subunit [Faecalibacterium prausnitzii]
MLGFNKKTQDASPQENTGGENKVFHFIKTHKKRCIAVVAAAAVLVAVIVPRKSRSASADLAYTQEKLGRRDIVNVYDGSGTINAADSYTVKSLVTGTVLTADFELGDSIEKGDILYTIDISDVENNLASAQLSVEQAQRNYDDIADMQNVRTKISGEVSSFAVAAGDAVQAGQAVATIRDTSVMLLAVDFPAAEAQSFVAGQAAQVMPDTTFETLNGTIRSVSGADPSGDASLMTCTVTIAVPNAGSLTTAQAAVAQVNGVSSLNSAHFTYQREETVVAAASGTVSELCVKEGSTVRQDDVILRITGKDLDKQTKNAADSLRAAELQMSSAEKTISHYTIDAPISGTIVDKKVKAGDKLSANDTAMQNLCTIYDMSYLEMKLNVDELKIRSLEVGQEVDITADAVPGETYKGVISSILVAGTTANGSTSYPVTVRIDDMGELLPGMNATAKITTASVKNVLALPNAALVRGSYVLVTKDSPSAANAETSMTAPDGYVYVKVTTGISDDDYIEVKSGLQEGDTIAYDNSSVSATDFYSNMMASAEGDDE